jgi:hypothetical protein
VTALAPSETWHRRQRALADLAAARAAGLWSHLDSGRIRGSWAELAPVLAAILRQLQLAAASGATGYVSASVSADGVAPSPVGSVVPSSLSGVAADGRPLQSLTEQPAVSTLFALSRGRSLLDALALGRSRVVTLARTEVADAGRQATGIAMTAEPKCYGYVRVVDTPSCGRCIVLAGRVYGWSKGFQRHPACNCTHQPVTTPDQKVQDPRDLFEQMTPDQQRLSLGSEANAEAVRQGADLGQVVNAQRGMYTAGGRQFTSEGTTRRGLAGKSLGKTPRLTPGQILIEAAGNREESLRLLRRFGYLI